MKKIVTLLLAVIMLLSFAACSQDVNQKETEAVDHSGHNHSHSHANLEPSAGNSAHLLAEYEALVSHYLEQKQQNPNGADIMFQQILNTQHELETYAGKVKEKMGDEAYLEFLNQVNIIGDRLYDNLD